MNVRLFLAWPFIVIGVVASACALSFAMLVTWPFVLWMTPNKTTSIDEVAP